MVFLVFVFLAYSSFAYLSRKYNNPHKLIFIFGKKGSGKSTYIKYLQDTSIKSIALCSSTGVSALNIGGMTLHSFFRLPISDIIDEESLFKQK